MGGVSISVKHEVDEVRDGDPFGPLPPRPPCPQVLEIGLDMFGAGRQRDLANGFVYSLHACPYGGTCATLGCPPRRRLTDKVLDVDRINRGLPIDDVAGAPVPRIKVPARAHGFPSPKTSSASSVKS